MKKHKTVNDGPVAAKSLTVSMKLSKLQKHILAELAECEWCRPCAMLSFYGFTREERIDPDKWPDFVAHYDVDALYLDQGIRLRSTGHSDSSKYPSALSAISRAIARLIERGLVERELIYSNATAQTGNARIYLTRSPDTPARTVNQSPESNRHVCRFWEGQDGGKRTGPNTPPMAA